MAAQGGELRLQPRSWLRSNRWACLPHQGHKGAMDDATVGASWCCDRCQDIGGWTPTSASTSGFSTIWWKPQAFQRLLSSWFHFTCPVCLLSSVTRWANRFWVKLVLFIHSQRDSQNFTGSRAIHNFLGLRSGLILRQIPQRCVTYSHLDGLILTLASWTWIFQRVRNHHTLLDHNTSKALSTSIITHLHRIMNACNCMYLYICILCICNVM